MARRYPPASWRPLGPQTEPLMRSHDIVCVHTMVGYLTSTDRYFRSGNGAGFQGTESHYGIGGPWGSDAGKGLDGAVWQWQDRARTADANYKDPYRVISVETADNAPRYASSLERWSPAQAASLVELLAWECSTAAHADCPSTWTCHREGIPPRLIPDTKPGRRGLGYHAQGVPGNGLVAGGVPWSKSRGKECPGTARIAQYKNEIIPAVQRRLATGRAPTPGRPVDPAPGMPEYPVQPGDTLRSIAERAYGDPDLWELIADANPKTLAGSTTLTPGMTLWLPADVPEEYLMAKLDPEQITDLAGKVADRVWRTRLGPPRDPSDPNSASPYIYEYIVNDTRRLGEVLRLLSQRPDVLREVLVESGLTQEVVDQIVAQLEQRLSEQAEQE